MSVRHYDKQLSVSTSTRDLSRKINKIRTLMYGYPEGITPKTIAAKTLINVNTVKSILPKMNDVHKISRGLYKVVKKGDGGSLVHELKDWNFHNCIMTCETSSSNRSFDVDLDILKYNVLINNGKATLRLSTDYPMNVSSLAFVAHVFKHFVSVTSVVMISSIEFNRDYRNLRLDGVNSISVDSLVEQFKVYQKRRGMRIEHKTKVPMSVASIVDMLSNNPNSVEFHQKLNQHSDAMKRVNIALADNRRLLQALLEREVPLD